MKRATLLAVLAGLILTSPLWARQNIVLNGSMEHGDGPAGIDPMVAAGWTEFGTNVERSPTVSLVPPGDGHSLKAFGDADSNSAGAFQEVADIAAGQSVVASVQLYSPSFDKLRASGQAGLVLEFLNLFGGTIELHEVYVMDASAPADTWIPAELGPLTAPEGTIAVRVTCRLQWAIGDVLGAAYWDDAQLSVDEGPNLLLNSDFEEEGFSAGQSPVGIDEWLGFNDQEKSDDIALDRTFSVKLGTEEPYSGLFQNMDALSAGDHIYMQAYVLHPSSDPLVGNSRVGLKLEFDPNAEVPPPEEALTFDETFDPDTWTPVELEATVPEDVTIARVVCIYTGDATTTGAVHFETAFAERDSQPGVNQLLNASFEQGPGGSGGLTNWTEFSSPDVSQAQKSCFEVPALDGWCTARAAGPAVAGIFQEITVEPGEQLVVSANLYTPSSDPLTGTGKAGVKIEWAVGGVPDDINIGGVANTIDADSPQDVWIPLYIDYTMPSGTSALARFTNLIERGTSFTGTAYIDACEAVVLNRFDGADADGDDDEDLHDFAWLQYAYTGANAGGLVFNGIVFDHDDDLDVDMADFDYFAPRMTGPQ